MVFGELKILKSHLNGVRQIDKDKNETIYDNFRRTFQFNGLFC